VGSQPGIATSVYFEDFELDLRTGELRRGQSLLKLQPQPAKILSVLVSRAGEVVTRQELVEQVWGSDTFVDFEQGLNFAIRQIRLVLDDDVDQPRFLDTIPRKGYRFIATVAPLAESAKKQSTPAIEPSDKTQAGKTPRRNKSGIRLASFAAVALAAVIAVYIVTSKPTSTNTAQAGIRSLVVLPLQNLSGDPSQEYFADGMTDELTTQLAKIKSIRVASRTSAMRYKGAEKPLPEIARELRVDVVVEGSIVRSGNRLKLTAQLIDAPTDRHLWADSYERDLRDMVSLQVEVAEDIAEQIRANLTPEDTTRLSKTKPVSPEAFEAYFKGRYFWNKRTEADLKRALGYFQEAIEKDPAYAQAYVGLADCYLSAGSYSLMEPSKAYDLAKAAALKALEIDDSLAEAHTPLAIIKAELDWDLPGAEKEFQQAIALDPNNPRTHQFYAEDVLEPEARNEEANRELALAQQLDPSSLITRAAAGFAYYLARQYDRAIQQEQETLELDSSFPKAHQILGRGYDQKAMYGQAIKEFQTASSLDPNPSYVADLARAYALAGRKAEARHTLAQLTSLSSHMYVHPYGVALVYVAMGDKDSALDWLEKARKERCWTLTYLNVDPRVDPLRGDPRFQMLIHRVGLPL
jgi:TolB-like protein/DNA-binding winged helix-turn-helix (wHTH) protein/Flp pilus assembly protein TadD